jgi:hypothetical protein
MSHLTSWQQFVAVNNSESDIHESEVTIIMSALYGQHISNSMYACVTCGLDNYGRPDLFVRDAGLVTCVQFRPGCAHSSETFIVDGQNLMTIGQMTLLDEVHHARRHFRGRGRTNRRDRHVVDLDRTSGIG